MPLEGVDSRIESTSIDGNCSKELLSMLQNFLVIANKYLQDSSMEENLRRAFEAWKKQLDILSKLINENGLSPEIALQKLSNRADTFKYLVYIADFKSSIGNGYPPLVQEIDKLVKEGANLLEQGKCDEAEQKISIALNTANGIKQLKIIDGTLGGDSQERKDFIDGIWNYLGGNISYEELYEKQLRTYSLVLGKMRMNLKGEAAVTINEAKKILDSALNPGGEERDLQLSRMNLLVSLALQCGIIEKNQSSEFSEAFSMMKAEAADLRRSIVTDASGDQLGEFEQRLMIFTQISSNALSYMRVFRNMTKNLREAFGEQINAIFRESLKNLREGKLEPALANIVRAGIVLGSLGNLGTFDDIVGKEAPQKREALKKAIMQYLSNSSEENLSELVKAQITICGSMISILEGKLGSLEDMFGRNAFLKAKYEEIKEGLNASLASLKNHLENISNSFSAPKLESLSFNCMKLMAKSEILFKCFGLLQDVNARSLAIQGAKQNADELEVSVFESGFVENFGKLAMLRAASAASLAAQGNGDEAQEMLLSGSESAKASLDSQSEKAEKSIIKLKGVIAERKKKRQELIAGMRSHVSYIEKNGRTQLAQEMGKALEEFEKAGSTADAKEAVQKYNGLDKAFLENLSIGEYLKFMRENGTREQKVQAGKSWLEYIRSKLDENDEHNLCAKEQDALRTLRIFMTSLINKNDDQTYLNALNNLSYSVVIWGLGVINQNPGMGVDGAEFTKAFLNRISISCANQNYAISLDDELKGLSYKIIKDQEAWDKISAYANRDTARAAAMVPLVIMGGVGLIGGAIEAGALEGIVAVLEPVTAAAKTYLFVDSIVTISEGVSERGIDYFKSWEGISQVVVAIAMSPHLKVAGNLGKVYKGVMLADHVAMTAMMAEGSATASYRLYKGDTNLENLCVLGENLGFLFIGGVGTYKGIKASIEETRRSGRTEPVKPAEETPLASPESGIGTEKALAGIEGAPELARRPEVKPAETDLVETAPERSVIEIEPPKKEGVAGTEGSLETLVAEPPPNPIKFPASEPIEPEMGAVELSARKAIGSIISDGFAPEMLAQRLRTTIGRIGFGARAETDARVQEMVDEISKLAKEENIVFMTGDESIPESARGFLMFFDASTARGEAPGKLYVNILDYVRIEGDGKLSLDSERLAHDLVHEMVHAGLSNVYPLNKRPIIREGLAEVLALEILADAGYDVGGRVQYAGPTALVAACMLRYKAEVGELQFDVWSMERMRAKVVEWLGGDEPARNLAYEIFQEAEGAAGEGESGALAVAASGGEVPLFDYKGAVDRILDASAVEGNTPIEKIFLASYGKLQSMGGEAEIPGRLAGAEALPEAVRSTETYESAGTPDATAPERRATPAVIPEFPEALELIHSLEAVLGNLKAIEESEVKGKAVEVHAELGIPAPTVGDVVKYIRLVNGSPSADLERQIRCFAAQPYVDSVMRLSARGLPTEIPREVKALTDSIYDVLKNGAPQNGDLQKFEASAYNLARCVALYYSENGRVAGAITPRLRALLPYVAEGIELSNMERIPAEPVDASQFLPERALDLLEARAYDGDRKAENQIALEAQRGNDRARTIISNLFLGYVEYTVKKYGRGSAAPYEDLVTDGQIGLMNAIKGFSPLGGASFRTYALHLIDGEILHGKRREEAQAAGIKPWEQEARATLRKLENEMEQKLGRAPTYKELADEMAIKDPNHTYNETIVQQLIEGRSSSLDKPLTEEEGTRADMIPDPNSDAGFRQILEKTDLESHFGVLKPIEKGILRRVADGETFAEIAESLGYEASTIQNYYYTAVGKLRNEIARAGAESEEAGVAQPTYMSTEEFLQKASERDVRVMRGIAEGKSLTDIAIEENVTTSVISTIKTRITNTLGQEGFDQLIGQFSPVQETGVLPRMGEEERADLAILTSYLGVGFDSEGKPVEAARTELSPAERESARRELHKMFSFEVISKKLAPEFKAILSNLVGELLQRDANLSEEEKSILRSYFGLGEERKDMITIARERRTSNNKIKSTLIEAMDRLLDGQSDFIFEKVRENPEYGSIFVRLVQQRTLETEGEFLVLQRIAGGRTQEQIAAEFGFARTPVGVYRDRAVGILGEETYAETMRRMGADGSLPMDASEKRGLFISLYKEGLTMREIAEKMNIEEVSARTQRNRIRNATDISEWKAIEDVRCQAVAERALPDLERYVELYQSGMPLGELAREMDLSRATENKYRHKADNLLGPVRWSEIELRRERAVAEEPISSERIGSMAAQWEQGALPEDIAQSLGVSPATLDGWVGKGSALFREQRWAEMAERREAAIADNLNSPMVKRCMDSWEEGAELEDIAAELGITKQAAGALLSKTRIVVGEEVWGEVETNRKAAVGEFDERFGPLRNFVSLWESGKAVHEITAELHISKPTVYDWRNRAAGLLGERGWAEITAKRESITGERGASEDKLIEFGACWQSGVSYGEIGEKFSISVSAVYEWRNKAIEYFGEERWAGIEKAREEVTGQITLTPERSEQFLQSYESGKSIDDIAGELVIPGSTAYDWRNRILGSLSEERRAEIEQARTAIIGERGLSPERLDRFIAVWEGSSTIEEAATQLEVSQSTVKNWRNIAIESLGAEQWAEVTAKRETGIVERKIERLGGFTELWQKGMSLEDIASKCKVTVETAREWRRNARGLMGEERWAAVMRNREAVFLQDMNSAGAKRFMDMYECGLGPALIADEMGFMPENFNVVERRVRELVGDEVWNEMTANREGNVARLGRFPENSVRFVELWKSGLSPVQIGRELGVSNHTVVSWSEKAAELYGAERWAEITKAREETVIQNEFGEFIELYQQGLENIEMADRMGIDRKTVGRIRDRAETVLSPKRWARITAVREEAILQNRFGSFVELYEKGLSLTEIGDELGVWQRTVSTWRDGVCKAVGEERWAEIKMKREAAMGRSGQSDSLAATVQTPETGTQAAVEPSPQTPEASARDTEARAQQEEGLVAKPVEAIQPEQTKPPEVPRKPSAAATIPEEGDWTLRPFSSSPESRVEPAGIPEEPIVARTRNPISQLEFEAYRTIERGTFPSKPVAHLFVLFDEYLAGRITNRKFLCSAIRGLENILSAAIEAGVCDMDLLSDGLRKGRELYDFGRDNNSAPIQKTALLFLAKMARNAPTAEMRNEYSEFFRTEAENARESNIHDVETMAMEGLVNSGELSQEIFDRNVEICNLPYDPSNASAISSAVINLDRMVLSRYPADIPELARLYDRIIVDWSDTPKVVETAKRALEGIGTDASGRGSAKQATGTMAANAEGGLKPLSEMVDLQVGDMGENEGMAGRDKQPRKLAEYASTASTGRKGGMAGRRSAEVDDGFLFEEFMEMDDPSSRAPTHEVGFADRAEKDAETMLSRRIFPTEPIARLEKVIDEYLGGVPGAEWPQVCASIWGLENILRSAMKQSLCDNRVLGEQVGKITQMYRLARSQGDVELLEPALIFLSRLGKSVPEQREGLIGLFREEAEKAKNAYNFNLETIALEGLINLGENSQEIFTRNLEICTSEANPRMEGAVNSSIINIDRMVANGYAVDVRGLAEYYGKIALEWRYSSKKIPKAVSIALKNMGEREAKNGRDVSYILSILNQLPDDPWVNEAWGKIRKATEQYGSQHG